MQINRIRFILHRQRRRQQEKGSTHLWLRVSVGSLASFVLLFIFLVGAGVATAVSVYTNYASTLPAASEIGRQTKAAFKTTKIYDRTGTVLLFEVFDPQGGNRTWVPLNKIPKYFRDAVVANEDRRFYDDAGTFFGIDPVGGGLPTDQPSDWPSVEAVQDYVSRIRAALDENLAPVLARELLAG